MTKSLKRLNLKEYICESDNTTRLMNLILGLFIAKNSLWKFSFSEIFNHYNQITESEHEKKNSKMWTRGVTVHITHGNNISFYVHKLKKVIKCNNTTYVTV